MVVSVSNVSNCQIMFVLCFVKYYSTTLMFPQLAVTLLGHV